MVTLAVNGAAGRMGSRILALAAASPDEFEIAGAFDYDKKLATDSLKGKGVLIDFSGPEGTAMALDAATKAGWGLVIGTTGLDPNTTLLTEVSSKTIPIVYSANMSVGINLVAEVLKHLAKQLGREFEISVSETHHVHKKDKPSGTALMLKEAMGEAHRRIEINSIRKGDIVGDHTVLFSGPAETIEITHRAQSRDVFALGALKAAVFVAAKKNGLYKMRDVLGLP